MAATPPSPTAPRPPADPSRATLVSRALVLVLAGLFLLGALGFAMAALEAKPKGTPAPASGAPAIPLPQATASPAAMTGAEVAVLAAGERPTTAGPAAERPGPTPVSPVTANPGLDATGAPSPSASAPPGPSAVPSAATSPSPSAGPSGDPSPGPGGTTARRTPVVPVAGFWSTRSDIGRRELVSALETGQADGFDRVVMTAELREPLEAALGIAIAPSVRMGDVAAVERAVGRGALGLVAAPDLAPRLRALDVDGVSLVGNDRVGSLDRWPLVVPLVLGDREPWSQRRTWTLVAGGDSFTDRGIYDRVVRQGKGIDYPFNGGRARITGSRCCGAPYDSYPVPTYQLLGDRGAVRRLISDADLAVVNHEQPVTEAWDWHSSGTRFSGKPELTEMFVRAGIDWVSLANNHIKDYGTDGIADTRRILARYGLRFGGAGTTPDEARRISLLDVDGVKVAIVPCLDIAPAAMAKNGQSGATPCTNDIMRRDLRAASRKADLVIAFPHWGVEYSRQPTAAQRTQAANWVRYGADLVLGAHSHVAGAIEEVDGVPVLYSMGNLIFDQAWASFTMQSFLTEATFHGDRLVQLRLHPFISHDQAQPNLMDAATDGGRKLLQQVRKASTELDW